MSLAGAVPRLRLPCQSGPRPAPCVADPPLAPRVAGLYGAPHRWPGPHHTPHLHLGLPLRTHLSKNLLPWLHLQPNLELCCKEQGDMLTCRVISWLVSQLKFIVNKYSSMLLWIIVQLKFRNWWISSTNIVYAFIMPCWLVGSFITSCRLVARQKQKYTSTHTGQSYAIVRSYFFTSTDLVSLGAIATSFLGASIIVLNLNFV